MSTSTEYDWKVSIPPLPRRGITLQLIVPPSAAYGSPAIDMPALLQAWDKASPQSTIRFTLITDFLAAANKLNPANDALELEKITRSRASLFLTRIITWIKLVYTTPNILLQVPLKCIHMYVASINGVRFTNEVIAAGGVMTLLDILNMPSVLPPDTHVNMKEATIVSLETLRVIARQGLPYRICICEAFGNLYVVFKGVRSAARLISKTDNEDIRRNATNMILVLAKDNEVYRPQVYKVLLSLLVAESSSTIVITAAFSGMSQLLPTLRSVHAYVMTSAIQHSGSADPLVQKSSFSFLKLLLDRKELQTDLVQLLISKLKIEADMLSPSKLNPKIDPKVEKFNLECLHQQNQAVRLLSYVAANNASVVPILVKQASSGLLHALANTNNTVVQRNSALLLQYLATKSATLSFALSQFLPNVLTKPESCFQGFTPKKIRDLRRNTFQEGESIEEASEDDSEDETAVLQSKGNSIARLAIITPENSGTARSTDSVSRGTAKSTSRDNVISREAIAKSSVSINAKMETHVEEIEEAPPVAVKIGNFQDFYIPFERRVPFSSLAGKKPPQEWALDQTVGYNQELDRFRDACEDSVPAEIVTELELPEISKLPIFDKALNPVVFSVPVKFTEDVTQ